MNLWKFTIRRCVLAMPTIFGVLLIVFALFRLVPGDAADLALGAHADQHLLGDLRHTLGIDRPLLPDFGLMMHGELRRACDCQFFSFLTGPFTGDLGISWQTRQPIWEMLGQGIMPSLSLTIPIFLGQQLVGIMLAFFVACRPGSFWDSGILALAVGTAHLPMVAMVALLQWFIAYHLGILPIHGWLGPQYLILPVMIGIFFGFGGHVRFYRTLLVDESQREYVRCAKAKGVDGLELLVRHVMPNVLVPVTTRLAMEIPHLILGSLLLERFFGVPGLGNLFIDAIAARDLPVITAMTSIGAVLFILGNLAGDIVSFLLRRRSGAA